MAKKQKRMSKEELQAPDEVEVALKRIWDRIDRYKGVIIGAIGALIVLGIVLWIVDATGQSAQDDRAAALREAVEPLNGVVGQAPTERPPNAPALVTFETRQAQLEAAAKGLASYASAFEGNDSMELVAIAAARIKLAQGDAAGAASAAQAWLTAHEESPLTPVVLELLASAQAQSGDAAAARATFEKLAAVARGPLAGEAWARVGDLSNPLFVDGGDTAKARDAYEKSLAAFGPAPKDRSLFFGKATLRDEVQHRLELLP